MIITLLAATAGLGQSSDISNYLQGDFQDASFVVHVVKATQSELRKINDDFGAPYRFEKNSIEVKEPFKLRIEATVEQTTVTYLQNGPLELVHVPGLINQKSDLRMKPGRRQTLFDFGILTPSLFDSLYTAKFVRTDHDTGNPIFDVFYQPQLKDKTRSRVWIDKARHIIAKRQWYGQNGDLKATFVYSSPQEISGVWIPTHVEVRNVDDVVAGITGYQSIKVNTGISDSLFAIH